MTLTEQSKIVNDEIQKTLRWFSRESERICHELEEQQGAEYKIDGNRAHFKELHKEFARRMNAIGKKYGFCPRRSHDKAR